MKIITPEQFGAVADGITNDFYAVSLALAEAMVGDCTVEFAADKTYYLGYDSRVEALAAFALHDCKNVTLRGCRTRILIDRPLYYTEIVHTENTVLEGFIFDYRVRPFALGTVLERNDEALTAVVQADRSLQIDRETDTEFAVLQRDDGRYHLFLRGVEPLEEENRYRLYFRDVADTRRFLKMTDTYPVILPLPGFAHRIERAFSITDNTDFTMRHCRVWSMARFGFAILRNYGTLLFDDLRVEQAPGEPCKIVGWRDCFHVKENHAKCLWYRCYIPGIDWLRRDTDNELPVRQVSSVAAQLGKKKVLTESFACCGWDVTPTELRRIVGFQFVGGVNWLCTHLVPYSEAGLRKHDYPAHYSHINRWVEQEFPAFNTFVSRLGGLIGESEELVNVAVLHPIRSAYFDYQRGDMPNEEEFHIRPLDEALRRDVRRLSAHGVNYHFVDETLLAKHGSVEGAALCCGRCRYTYWVLPHVQTMDASTERLLRQFVQNGGKVLVLGENPQYREAETYDYAYLVSNCSFEDICAAQPCQVTDPDTELYYTYRRLQGRDVLVVQNASGVNNYTQRFQLDGRYRSFQRLDLNTLETESVPLELTFEPNGCMVLFPDEAAARPRPHKPEIPVYLEQDAASFDENTLVVDTVRYSRDGLTFSKPYPVAGLFAKLLEERYEGDIYFAYTFSVRERPGRLCLRVEPIPGAEYTFNDRALTMTGSPEDPDVWCADVTALVHEGDNTLVVKADWFQNDRVYYALFGENVTESLKNCLVYDRELEPIYCVGDFGVYTDGGFRDVGDGFVAAQDFYIAAPPRRITEPVTDGLPFFSGILTVRKILHLTEPDVFLRIPGRKMVVRVRLNGHEVRTVLFGETVDIGAYAVPGDNELELTFTFSNRNTYGPHHSTDLVTHHCAAPEFFEMKDWKDGVSPGYSVAYELQCFGCTRC